MESPPASPQDPDRSLETPATPSPTPSNADSPKALQSLSPLKKPQPVPWSRPETTNLIEAYQEKWYSLKKGQLKATQWEEVAVTVAVRCGYEVPTKTALQCRHKIEKLRKRYRAEKQKPNPRAWEYFDLMENLERGPLPISARPMALIPYQPDNRGGGGDDGEAEAVNEARFNIRSKRNRSKRISQVLRSHVDSNSANKPTRDTKSGGGGRSVAGGGGRVPGFSGFLQRPVFQKRTERVERYPDREVEEAEDEEEEEEDDDDDEVVGEDKEMMLELAAEIKAFAEKFVKMERKKMEVVKETERNRIEMENKRMEMVLESHRLIMDNISRVFGSQNNKKLKTDH